MSDESEDVRVRLRTWWLAMKEYEATFEEGPLSEILSADAHGGFAVPDEKVPQLLFNDGPTSAAAIRAYLRANGDPLILENYGAYLIRQAGGVTPDGTIDLAALDRWEARFSDALSVLPGLKSKLAAAREAQVAVDKAIADKDAALDDFRESPAMLYVDHDPMTATEKFFELPDTAAAMRALLERLNGNQEAIDGLHRAVADYILAKIGVTSDRAAAYFAFIAAHEQALATLFGEPKMQTLRDVGTNLKGSLSAATPQPEITRRLPPSILKRGWRGLFGR